MLKNLKETTGKIRENETDINAEPVFDLVKISQRLQELHISPDKIVKKTNKNEVTKAFGFLETNKLVFKSKKKDNAIFNNESAKAACNVNNHKIDKMKSNFGRPHPKHQNDDKFVN